MISPELRILIGFLVAFFSALFVIPKIASIAQSIGLLDRPGQRKVHQIPRPLVGGIGMVISATFSCLLLVPLAGARGVFLGLAVLLLVGFLDDFRELGHRQKFLGQIGAGVLAMYFSKVLLVSFGDLFSLGELTFSGNNIAVWFFTIFCIVGVINSLNLIDGLDGLAGGVSFIAFFTFALHASFAGDMGLMIINLAFAGAVLGFLRYNWPPASVFMGDAGSLCLGFVLACMSIIMTQGETALMSPVCPLLILAVPITDTVIVMSKRALRGTSPFKADMYHLHHIFLRFGMRRATAVKVILVISLIFSSLSLLDPIFAIPDYGLFAIYLFYLTVYVISSFFIVYTMRASLKYQRQKLKDNTQRVGNGLKVPLLFKTGLFKKVRKDVRYTTRLDIVCLDKKNKEQYFGTLLNMSDSGCSALIPDLHDLKDLVIVEISFPIDGGTHAIPFPAEHLWVSEKEKTYHHGFSFRKLSDEQQSIFISFVVKYNKRFV